MTRLLSKIKQIVVPRGFRPRTIISGPFQGIRMELDFSFQTQLYLGLFEREMYPWLKEFSQGIHTAIDIGAGYGEYTLYFLTKTPAHQVFSFEPSRDMQECLFANLELNSLANDTRLHLSSKFVGRLDGKNECTLDLLLTLIKARRLTQQVALAVI